MENLRKNKKGQAGIALIVLAVVAVLFTGAFFAGLGPFADSGPSSLPAAGCPESTGVLTINGFNALDKGSNITPTVVAGIGSSPVTTSVTSGTTTFPVGKSITFHNALANFIDTSNTITMECGGSTVDVPMFSSTSDNPAIRIKNDEDNFMTDTTTGGNVNQTNIAAGETLTLTVEFKGTSQESSGNGIFIVETASNTGANITRIELDGVAGKAVPTVHPSANAGSAFFAFDVPAIEGSKTVTKTLTIITTPTGDVSGAVLTDWYAKQDFVDDDGSISNGIQDSDGTAKYENTLDFDFFIDAS